MKLTPNHEIVLTVNSSTGSSLYRIHRSDDAETLIQLAGMDGYLSLILHNPLILTSAIAFSPSHCLLLTSSDSVNMKRMYDKCLKELKAIPGIPKTVDISGIYTINVL